MLPTFLILKVHSHGHQPVANATECRLAGIGGTLGRALENDLVLDDPGKQISRVHARVLFRAGSYFLEDAGSNPSVVNDRPLGKGREVQLAHGDRIVVGDYGLEVRLETAAAAAGVIAPAPLNDAALPLFKPPPVLAAAPLLPLPVPAGWDAADVSLSPALAPDAFASAKILDVLAGFPVGAGATAFDPLGLNLGQSVGSDFELNHAPAARATFLPPAQTSTPPPAARAALLAIPDDYDPLADFFAPAVAMQSPPAVARAVVPPPPPLPPLPTVMADRTVLSTPPPAPARAAPPSAVTANLDFPADDNAVLQALLRGLGLPDLRLKGSAEELAETVGALLREATGGVMDLLLARSLTKKESRVDMTMIAVRSNNPLKFFPNPESALTQLLTNAMAGYLPSVPAMEGAFADLKAHELAVMVGMRAALAAVLQRFDPAQIDAQLALPTGMDKMLGANRKSRLWDRLVEVYGGITRDADGELQRLYGEQFSAAYEEQIKRLSAGF